MGLTSEHPAAGRGLSRREFLQGVVATTGLGAMGLAAAGCSAATKPPRPGPAPRPTTTAPRVGVLELSDGLRLPTAAWVGTENARPGTTGWVVTGQQRPHAIEGFADRTSAGAGDVVTVYVNTEAPTFHVEAYRMGYYQALGARLVWSSTESPGRVQPPSSLTPGVNTVECRWSPSLSFPVAGWPPGCYLLKLVGSGGQQQFVPLTVRDDTSTAAFVIQNSVTTWQAYNLWGGYSLYFGVSGRGMDYSHRSRVVSFDRPYPLDWANGASDFMGNEFPLVYMAERLGLDVTYWTDVDLHQRYQLLARRRALLSLGHDEYWSSAMRQGATDGRDAGLNLAFFGANACYRHIRFEPSPVGPDRHQVCYKDASEDPLNGLNNAEVTVDWSAPPDPRPEATLTGNTYQCNPVSAPLVVADASSWLWQGTGLADGYQMDGVVGTEYDGYAPGGANPANVQILAHSPLTCHGRPGHSDATWYTQAGGGGVFASGTNRWIFHLADTTGFPTGIVPGPIAGITAPLLQATENLLAVLGSGPASATRPSVANWQQYYR